MGERLQGNSIAAYEKSNQQGLGNQNEKPSSNTIISGHKMKDLSIAGFNRLNKTGGNTWDIVGANTILCCMCLKWKILKEKIDEMNAYNAYARIEECIGIDSNSTSSIQLKKLFEKHFAKGITTAGGFYDLAIATLEDSCELQNHITERSESTELIEDLVKLLHEDRAGLPHLTIGEITKYLN